MKLLFDTSAIINLIQQLEEKAVPLLTDQFTLDLSFYEAGNVVWKLNYRKTLSITDTIELLGRIQKIWDFMQVIKYNPLTLQKIYEFAVKYTISFYDASFLFQAVNLNAILITDDFKLQNKIPKEIAWKTSEELV